jgi:hypothetical protein
MGRDSYTIYVICKRRRIHDRIPLTYIPYIHQSYGNIVCIIGIPIRTLYQFFVVCKVIQMNPISGAPIHSDISGSGDLTPLTVISATVNNVKCHRTLSHNAIVLFPEIVEADLAYKGLCRRRRSLVKPPEYRIPECAMR